MSIAIKDPKTKKTTWKPFLRNRASGGGKKGKGKKKKGGDAKGGSAQGPAAGGGGYNPSAAEPCRKCGGTDHWARDCPAKEAVDEGNEEASQSGAAGGTAAVAAVATVTAAAGNLPTGAGFRMRDRPPRPATRTSSSSCFKSGSEANQNQHGEGSRRTIQVLEGGGVYSRPDP